MPGTEIISLVCVHVGSSLWLLLHSTKPKPVRGWLTTPAPQKHPCFTDRPRKHSRGQEPSPSSPWRRGAIGYARWICSPPWMTKEPILTSCVDSLTPRSLETGRQDGNPKGDQVSPTSWGSFPGPLLLSGRSPAPAGASAGQQRTSGDAKSSLAPGCALPDGGMLCR